MEVDALSTERGEEKAKRKKIERNTNQKQQREVSSRVKRRRGIYTNMRSIILREE